MSTAIELRDVSVDSPAGSPILSGVKLAIGAGESVALIGRSGAGKTTTLRLINGLVRASRGEVFIDGAPFPGIDLIDLRRHTGYIIQGSGLFPHRTVFENIATVPRLLGWEEPRIRAAAESLMTTLALPLSRFADRRPRSLSGGEQQRVGIARALIAEPSLLLCDEPFGALDPIVRQELQDAFLQLRVRVTLVFVTHDLAEALKIAKRIVLFEGGRPVADAPSDLFLSQSHPLIEQFASAAWPGGGRARPAASGPARPGQDTHT